MTGAGVGDEPTATGASGGGTPLVSLIGRLSDLPKEALHGLLNRGQATSAEVESATAEVIRQVRADGDAALLDLASRFDKAVPTALEVLAEECEAALASLDPDLRAALEAAAENIRVFHAAQLPQAFELEAQPGIRLGRRAEPLASVGVYVPGGRASYPSSVLMGVIPAKVAGVGQVVVCTPPAQDGRPPAAVLAACALAGADRVFAVGGAGAVAAMAFGTATVPQVNKVVGPGNAYVTAAKRQLNGVVAIDCPAGPSEVLIVADAGADPELVALELIAQAEHDPDASAVLVSVSEELTLAVAATLESVVRGQPREEVVRAALRASGALLTADTLEEAVGFANAFAPEHLSLMVRAPRELLPRVRNAGTVFLGDTSSVVFGDYATGANHTLPTAGLARSYSGLGTLDFVRMVTFQEVAPEAAADLADVVVTLAAAEGLPGHAAAARGRAGTTLPPAAPGTPLAPRPRLRAAYRHIHLYDPRRAPVGVDLSDNTNLFGPAPGVAEAVGALRPEQYTRYPSLYAAELRQELAALHGVAPENVTTGSGLDGVIDAAVRAFCDPGARLAYPDPTFGMVALFGQMNGVQQVPVPLTEELDVNVTALLNAGADMVYVCDPNNPTGRPVPPADLERLSRGSTGVVLVDEAYADFAGRPAGPTRLVANTLVLRTLSKAYGLAGLRVGYAVGPAELVLEVEKSRGPYKITAPAEAAALAVLRGGREWLTEVIARTVENRGRLTSELEARGLRPLPSAANFVLIPALPPRLAEAGEEPTDSATALGTRLRAQGVAVRVFPNLPRIGPAIRVSVGPWPMLERFLAALDRALEGEP